MKGLAPGRLSPNYDLGLLNQHISTYDPIKFFEKGSGDTRCKYYVAASKKDQTDLLNMKESFPLCYIALGNLEKDLSKSVQYYIEAGKQNIPLGWFKAGCKTIIKDPKMGVEFLTNACNQGMSSAFMKLWEYYLDNDKTEKMIEILKEGQEIFPYASIKLCDFYIKKDKKKGEEFYLKNDLKGFEYVKGKKEEGKKVLINHFLELKSIIDGKHPILKRENPEEIEL